MQITVKEAKFLKEGESKKGKWKLYKVIGDDGTEYTTFDAKAGHLTPGTIIESGPITLDGDNRSLKEVTVISEGPASSPKPNGDMSKEDWETKQRVERASFEAQTAYNGIIKLLESKVMELSHATAKKALDWAETKLDSESPPRTATKKTETKQAEQPTETPAEGLTFKNVGEFLAACNNAGVPRNKVMEKLGVDEKSLPRINITESWDIIYEEIIKPSKEK